MAEVLLFHHVQGLTEGVHALADAFRQDGHTVHTPDLLGGRTFEDIEDGLAYASANDIDRLVQEGAAAADMLGSGLVYAGFSFGVMIAQRLAQTRRGARGALLLSSCLPVSQYGPAWPKHVPVQIHGKEDDEFFLEDLPAAEEIVATSPHAELFLYPGAEHLFADSSLPAYDPEATKLLVQRARLFLAAV